MTRFLNFYFLFFIFLIVMCSCKEEADRLSGADYTIITTGLVSSTNGERYGSVSDYNSASKELKTIPFSIGNEPTIVDVNLLGDYLYAYVGYINPSLKKIDLKTGAEVSSVKTYLYSAALVNVSADKILISSVEQNYETNEMLLVTKIYNEDLTLADSIAQSHIGIRLYDTEVVGNKLIYSVFTDTNSNFIYILDLNTRQFLSPLPFSSRITEILLDKGGDLMFFFSHKVVFADPQTFNTIRTVENGVINPNSGQPSFALDKKNDVLYCLGAAAQPSAIAFYIYSLNLATNQASSAPMNQMMDPVGSPLIYEAESERIITGVSGGIKFYSREGEIVDQVSLPSKYYKLFVR